MSARDARRRRAKDSRLYFIDHHPPETSSASCARELAAFSVCGTTGNVYRVTLWDIASEVLQHEVLTHEVLTHEVLTHEVLTHEVLQHEVLKHETHYTCTCPDHLDRQNVCKHIFFVLYAVLKFPEGIEPEDLSVEVLDGAVAAAVERLVPVEKRTFDPATDECCICFELLSAEEVEYCRRCGNGLHAACLVALRKATAGKAPCPLCRG